MLIRKRVKYRGHVQGVGFRATCHSIASRQGVSGYVRNLADGGVELVMEGEQADLQAVLDEVAGRMEGHIRGSTIEEEPPQGEIGFRIER